MTGRYQSPLYRSIVERAKRNERQEDTMALPGKMPTRERLTELAGRIQHIFTHHGYTEEVGMTFSEMAALVKLAQDVTNAPPASDPVTGLTDPFAAEYEVVIPANVKNVRIRIEKSEASKIVMDTGSVYLDGERVQEVISRGMDGVTRTTPAIPAEPEVGDRLDLSRPDYVEPLPCPEDPRAPKPPADVSEAATDFQAGDWVVLKEGGPTLKVAAHGRDSRGHYIRFAPNGPMFPPANFRRATDNEILAATSIGW